MSIPAGVSGAALAEGEAAARATSTVRDFVTLTKPSVMQLVLFTSAVAMFLAPGTLHPVLALAAMLALALGAAAAAAINNWFDSDIDPRMGRTRLRPTASGRIAPEDAATFGVTLAIVSVMLMGLALNWLAAALLAFTIGFYVLVYTAWLKRRTPQNIVIGGAAGAFPPAIAWAAVTGDVGVLPLVMVAIIFLWTPPHFWALALYRTADYARVGVPMLPVVAGRRTTSRQILVYTALLVLVTLVPVALGELGWFYALAALGLGLWFLGHAVRLWRHDSDRAAMRAFRFSIVYLFALFGAMALDRLVERAWAAWPL
jgi:protoheme IX farnesyltransferase